MNKVTIIVLCLVTPLVSCAGTTQTKHLFQKNPSVTMSSQELRVRVRSQARPLAGIDRRTPPRRPPCRAVDSFRAAQLLAVVLPLLLTGGLILVWFARKGE
ncbi:MAG: hypothetical protein ABFS37_12280 [Acidobacteriota bacterium]